MKYWVSGSNKDTGARMSLEVEADSKAAAERDAGLRGMNVQRAVEMGSGLATPAPRRARGNAGGGASLVRIVILVIFFVVAWYYIVPRVRHLLGK